MYGQLLNQPQRWLDRPRIQGASLSITVVRPRIRSGP